MLKGVGKIMAVMLLAGTVGCGTSQQGGSAGKSNSGAQQQTQDGSKAKAQSESGGQSALDQELKRQSEIYKEHLKHNAEQAAKHREADKQLLERMRTHEQQARQDELKRLQIKEGLRSEEDTEQGGQDGQRQQNQQKKQNKSKGTSQDSSSSTKDNESTGSGGSGK